MTDEQIDREVRRQLAIMREGVVDFHGEEDLARRLALGLREGRPLRVKLGLDPSSADLHLGHSVVLMKLRRFQELGHTPIFLVGDFTARIGDPSGRNKTRPPLDPDQIKENARTYVAQVAKLLDVGAVEIRFNGEWMDSMGPGDFVRLCSRGTVARMLERDDFAKRHAGGTPIFVHEFLYPFVQGYDSVALEADVELGGTDQTFNLLMGREIQRAYGQAPQAVLTHPLLVGLDGHEKMSKSLGNSIGLTDDPAEMYGKVMSLPDAAMAEWCRLLSAGEWPDLVSAVEALAAGEGDPMALKHDLAGRIVSRMHDEAAARDAKERFQRVVQRKQVPEEVPEVEIGLAGREGLRLFEVLTEGKLAPSRSEARRLVQQGAVSVDGVRQESPMDVLAAGSFLIRVGKRRFARVQIRSD
ncbi:MAG TPA: tyrosine--tRNA ligase [Deltaproteobacteria bacterium]|nr:tyrosine--tRNA ligase [Deltaproteobacteria bacterium]